MRDLIELPDGWLYEGAYSNERTYIIWPGHGAVTIHWLRRSASLGWSEPQPSTPSDLPRGRGWRKELITRAVSMLHEAGSRLESENV